MMMAKKLLQIFVIYGLFIFSAYSEHKSLLREQFEKGEDDILFPPWKGKMDINLEINAMRNAIKWVEAGSSDRLWSKNKNEEGRFTVQYVITSYYESEHLETIHKSMEEISQNTCIDFEDRNMATLKHDSWFDIQNQKGCYVEYVGRADGQNVVSLGHSFFSTCLKQGTIIHEFLHKLGLWHEQSRYDRDHYVEINFENVESGREHNFKIIPQLESNNYGVEYDYTSVMHYPQDGFSADGSKTIITKDPNFQNIIGTSETASPGDYKKICSIYNCTRCMGKPFTTQAYNHCPSPKLPRYNSECDGRTPDDMEDYMEKCCMTRRRTFTAGLWADRSHPCAGTCNCQHCKPASNCLGSDARYFPANFASNCCGRCGAKWLRDFCDNRPEAELHDLREREMCPPDEDSTLVPVSEYSGHCKFCVDCEPDSACEGSDAINYPSYYAENCCGRCGNDYILEWCRKLQSTKLSFWKENGYCPEDLTTTTVAPPTTTTTAPITTTAPDEGSLLEKRRNCDLCSPDRAECVTSNSTYFRDECCGHCGLDWMNRHCNWLALSSAINLESSLFLFFWRKLEKCSMHALTPIAYKHFDGLDLNVDYTAVFCKQCEPKPDCDRSFLKHLFSRLHPYYYHQCCGFCGYKWLKDWCNTLNADEKVIYNKLCPSADY